MGKLEIRPRANIDARIEVPGSKSITQRALEISALVKGTSELSNVLFSDDTLRMMEALQLLGVQLEFSGSSLLVTPPKQMQYDGKIFLGNAGTAMRFLTGFFSLGFGRIELVGDNDMNQRPIDDLVEALNPLIDGSIEAKSMAKGRGCPPVAMDSRGLLGGETILKGDTSSQYLSSILMIAPYAASPVKINISGDLTSKPYADMTISVMEQFGGRVERDGYESFSPLKGEYLRRTYEVEGDASSASYFFAAAAITGGKVRVTNVSSKSVQGDIKFADVLEMMGCKVIKGSNYVEVAGPEKLRGVEVDMNAMPDTAQTLAVLSAAASGVTLISGIGNLKVKETDRIKALETELARVGITAEATKDSLTIHGGKPHGATIETYGDHRMAMSFSVLGLAVPGITIRNPEVVSKSFPNFYERFNRL